MQRGGDKDADGRLLWHCNCNDCKDVRLRGDKIPKTSMCYGSWSSLEPFLSRVNIQATVSIVEGSDLHEKGGKICLLKLNLESH